MLVIENNALIQWKIFVNSKKKKKKKLIKIITPKKIKLEKNYLIIFFF
jgi:hypothetical protein